MNILLHEQGELLLYGQWQFHNADGVGHRIRRRCVSICHWHEAVDESGGDAMTLLAELACIVRLIGCSAL